ncbi:hypothetical protein L226DRAFT_514969 [Lentinus tigrinus ALCF2SS1-7]|uniref:Fe2OG dioxygenase domain-containing protein n=1 Tax=Lentinus tigrinus ALCF2SS1-6 TaxID=1328759 RepID=A0A5C2RSD9_9APHY|nr:hypothetical protein L227DRAFT_657514 [Lentinus tigrinus ALCF2SS1-6]RPD70000.1 hypothetical protein L226DRAFT_514969 [Lentinus tigrinus ALCF2SS1-7]
MSDGPSTPEPPATSDSPLSLRLRATLGENPPFCSGTLGLQPADFTLYYGKGKDARQLDLSGTSAQDVEALDELEKACEAATFGRNAEAVLDETYRKAGKMDSDKFLLGLDVDKSRLVDIVRAGLLAGNDERRAIRAELYKLNVYGKHAFFKPHKDTPRGADMFGSLVIVFPTPHEGGALVLRDEGDEWTFDAALLLSATAHYEMKRIAYIAFFSDVEHEVLPITSGHRVTITYNLYWAGPPAVAFPDELTIIYPKHSNFSAIGEALVELLADPTFLPQGGTLGFGLRHAYPFETRWKRGMPNPLDTLRGWLKGSDAALLRALQALSLDPLLRLISRDAKYHIDVMLDRMLSLGNLYNEPSELCLMLLRHIGGIRLVEMNFDGTPNNRFSHHLKYVRYELEEATSAQVYWVTKCGDVKGNLIGSQYTAFGNEPTTAYLYLTPSLFVDVGPAGDRANVAEGVAGVKAAQAQVQARLEEARAKAKKRTRA